MTPPAQHRGGRIVTGPVGPAAATSVIALLSGNAGLMHWLSERVGQAIEVRLMQWRTEGRPRQVDKIVSEVAADGIHVLCVGDDVPLDLAFAVSSLADRNYAHISVILLAAPWPEVWRHAMQSGVRDVVDPSKGEAELGPALQRALDRAAYLTELQAAAAAPEQAKGRVIVVLSAKGGTGKTMVAANLVTALAGMAPGPVALVDLDVQFGDAASALGIVPEHTIAGLSAVPDIDSTTLKVFLTPHEPSGAFVLCGATSPEEGDNVTDKHASRVVELLARDFACVVVDTPAGIEERTLAVLDHATDVVLVSTMDVASIRNLGKEVYALDRVGLLPAEREFVLNRADARVGIDVADVRAALGMDVDTSVPSTRSVPLSMNQGRPLVLDDPGSPAGRALIALAQRFVPAGSDGQAGQAGDAGGRNGDTGHDGGGGKHAAVRSEAGRRFRRKGVR